MLTQKKLKSGDEIRIIAPSDSFRKNVTTAMRSNAVEILESVGLEVTFGKYVHDQDSYFSASIEKRVEDLHEAFENKNVKGIFAVSGGTSANELLPHLDYNLINKNPKFLCGHSDLTNIQLALYQKSSLPTYYGPHFAALGGVSKDDLTYSSLKKQLFTRPTTVWKDSLTFYDSAWDRNSYETEGRWIIKEGEAAGTLLGGNLLTMNFLSPSDYFPKMDQVILFVEDNAKINGASFSNHLHALFQSKKVINVRGMLIGRFQPESKINANDLNHIVSRIPDLADVPVIANLDFGHTLPMHTIPIGAAVEISARSRESSIILRNL